MTLQRCQLCRRLTVASFCSSCSAGMSGEVDREYLNVLASEEARFAMGAVIVGGSVPDWTGEVSVPEGAEPIREEVTAKGPVRWYATDAMRVQLDPESMQNMVAQQQRAANADMESYLARLSLPWRSRAWSRLRRWLSGAP